MNCWIYQDSIPDFAKAAAHNITTIYIDPRSTNAADVISQIEGHGLTAGIYTVPGWQPQMNGVGFAQWTSYMLNKLLPRRNGVAGPYMADIEGATLRDGQWVTGFLDTYRRYQPRRPSAFTTEPFQGGYVPTALLAQTGFDLYPQTYYGDMRPADPAAVVLEMARQGMPPNSIHPFYDGAALPADARDGCVFTLERIP